MEVTDDRQSRRAWNVVGGMFGIQGFDEDGGETTEDGAEEVVV